jgi:hypothetical protein
MDSLASLRIMKFFKKVQVITALSSNWQMSLLLEGENYSGVSHFLVSNFNLVLIVAINLLKPTRILQFFVWLVRNDPTGKSCS